MNDRVPAVIDHMVAADFGRGPRAARAALARHLATTPGAATTHEELDVLWRDLGALDRPELVAANDRLPRSTARWAAAAAMVVATLGGATAWLNQHPSAPQIAAVAAPMQLTTGRGERRSVRLADGSVMMLSASTAATVTIGSRERRVRLTAGEAFFIVAKDPSRPFVVAAGRGEVRAVGTAFNVRVDPARVHVTVTEGRVLIRPRRDRTPMVQHARPGQQVVYGVSPARTGATTGDFMTTPRPVGAERALDWTRGELAFAGEPLADVIEEVNRHSLRTVTLHDRRLATMPIHGVLHAGDVDGLISFIEAQRPPGKGPAASVSFQ